MKLLTITQKPCVRKSMSFEGEQHKIEHNGSRKKFSVYISMLWSDTKLMYGFYEVMNSTNKHEKPSGESEEICHEDYMEKTDSADMG
jgi:hypothetical protein